MIVFMEILIYTPYIYYNVNDITRKTMTPQELLDQSLVAAGYFVKSSSKSVAYQGLQGYTVEDIGMDAVESILKSKIPLEDISKTYVNTVVYHLALNLKRRQPIELGHTNLVDATEPLLGYEETEAHLLSTLSEAEQDLYTMSISAGMSDVDVAHFLGSSARTVRRRVMELKEKIKEYLSNGSPD